MATEDFALLLYVSLKDQRPSGKRGRPKETSTQPPSPGIQIVTHTVSYNGAAHKKVQIPVNILDSLLAG